MYLIRYTCQIIFIKFCGVECSFHNYWKRFAGMKHCAEESPAVGHYWMWMAECLRFFSFHNTPSGAALYFPPPECWRESAATIAGTACAASAGKIAILEKVRDRLCLN